MAAADLPASLEQGEVKRGLAARTRSFREPTADLLFAESDATPISTDAATLKSWLDARAQLAEAPKYWLATGRPDGGPHVMPVLGVWQEQALYIATRPGSRKGRNLALNDNGVVTVSTETVDLVVECSAAELESDNALQRASDAFAQKYGWRLTIRGGRAHEDTLPGSPVYLLCRLEPQRAFGFGPDGMTATRWIFDAPPIRTHASGT